MRCRRGFALFTAVFIAVFSISSMGAFALHVDAVDSLSGSSSSGSGSGGGSGGTASDTPVAGDTVVDAVPDSLDISELEIIADRVTLSIDAQSDEFPSGAGLKSGVYMQLDTTQFGNITVWVPAGAQYRSFALNDNDVPINITSGTITGYYYGSTDYSVRWSSFGTAAYRPISGSSTWYDLGVRDVISTNVDLSQGQYLLLPSSEMLLFFILFLIGAAVIWITSR